MIAPENEDILLHTVSALCRREKSSHASHVVRELGMVLDQQGDKSLSLVCKRLNEAKTNASFKIWLEGRQELALFAKQAFSYALWQPDKSVVYDIQRTENEALAIQKATKLLAKQKQGPRAHCPMLCFCVDVPENASKLLVTEWINNTEPLANQFLDGNVDHRVIERVSQSLALFNLSPVEDVYFNDGIRPMMRSCWPAVVDLFMNAIASSSKEEPDRCIQMMEKIGPAGIETIVEQVDQKYMERQVFGHGDAHVFNMLVEKRLEDGSFGDLGTVIYCDWEMSFVGSAGRDVGFFQGFPLACALCHAASGSRDKATHILSSLDLFWSSYAHIISEHRDALYVEQTYRSYLAWTGLCLFPTYYLMKLFIDVWPLEGAKEKDKKEALASIGIVGLKTMKWGYCNDEPELKLEMLQSRFKEAVGAEIDHLLSCHCSTSSSL